MSFLNHPSNFIFETLSTFAASVTINNGYRNGLDKDLRNTPSSISEIHWESLLAIGLEGPSLDIWPT